MVPILLSLGSINADFQVRLNQPPGQAETLLAHDFARFSGGKAANTAYIGALFGVDSRLLGRVGSDDLAEQALGPLRQRGVDTSGVSRTEHSPTAVSMIMVPPEGKKQIVLAGNANDDWDEKAINELLMRIEQVPRSAWLVVDCEIDPGVVDRVITLARSRDMPVVLDPSFASRIDYRWLEGLSAMTPNCEEASILAGMPIESLEHALHAAQRFRQQGVRLACVKLSNGGVILVSDYGSFHISSSDMRVVDSTGAGDAFTGVLAISLLQGLDPLHAACRAVAAADLAVTVYGSQPAYATIERVDRHVMQIKHQVKKLDV